MQELTNLTFEERGKGACPIICLHGIGGNTASFAPQLDELSQFTRVIAINLPGYGGSKITAPLSFESLSNQMLAFLDEANIEKAILLGQSIGGMVAIDFALRFSERLVKLILVGTSSAFGGKDESFKDSFLAARLAPLDAGKTMSELAAEFVPEIIGPIADPSCEAAAIQSMSEVPIGTYREIIKCLITFDRRNDFASIQIPTCLIAGEHDRNAPAKTMQRMARGLPNAEFHLVEGAGHLINLEAGQTTNNIIKNFLNLGG